MKSQNSKSNSSIDSHTTTQKYAYIQLRVFYIMYIFYEKLLHCLEISLLNQGFYREIIVLDSRPFENGLRTVQVRSVESFTHTFAEVEELGKTEPYDDRLATSADIDLIMYTSGTTGNPKGVMLSHQAVLVCSKTGSKAFFLVLLRFQLLLILSSVSFDCCSLRRIFISFDLSPYFIVTVYFSCRHRDFHLLKRCLLDLERIHRISSIFFSFRSHTCSPSSWI